MSENKKFYWLKLKDNFFDENEIKVLLTKENGPRYVLIWQKLLLKAIKSKEIGLLRFNEEIPYTPELLATVLDENEDIIKGALSMFHKLRMIDILENGDIWLKAADDLVGSETDKAAKMRKLRDSRRKQLPKGNNVTDCYETLTRDRDRDREEKDIDIDFLYSLYPSKCPVGKRSTGKTSKDKEKISKLLKKHSKEHLEECINLYLDVNKKTNCYIQNFSTFLNNLPDIKELKECAETTSDNKEIIRKILKEME